MIHETNIILKNLQQHIKKGKPFSNIRLGDACNIVLGLVLVSGKFKKLMQMDGAGRSYNRKIVRGRIGIPPKELHIICKRLVKYCNEANYIDNLYLTKDMNRHRHPYEQRIYSLWERSHKLLGIHNQNYSSPLLNHWSVVEGDKNLYQIMKGKRVYFINNAAPIVMRKFRKHCSKIGGIRTLPIPKKQFHSGQFEEIQETIEKEVDNYDLFLIGAGILGKIYCGYVKELGGVAFDVGRVFKMWKGKNFLPEPIKGFLTANEERTLYRRLKKGRDVRHKQIPTEDWPGWRKR